MQKIPSLLTAIIPFVEYSITKHSFGSTFAGLAAFKIFRDVF
ncbi:MAG: hypothetical protein VXX60_02000 [Bacteroidota bacterium]|nr:hypothetical protein [Bacteroidota bacterium]